MNEKTLDLLQIKKEIFVKLLTDCKKAISKITEDYKTKVYAFVLYPAPAFVGFGLAFSTRESLKDLRKNLNDYGVDDETMEMLKDHSDLLEKLMENKTPENYYELTACEWEYIDTYPELFEELNKYIYDCFDQFYDTGIKPVEIEMMFKEVVIEVFYELEKSNCFENDVFEKNILKGVQITDNSDIELIKSISKEVNSEKWHNKLCEVLDGE